MKPMKTNCWYTRDRLACVLNIISLIESPNPDISRVEVAATARRRAMKLYYGTANGPQRSGCGQVGSPEG